MDAHIIVIEDDLALQDLYRFLLEAEGYTVTISAAGYQDISTLVELHPDLIIIDLLIGNRQQGWNMLHLLKSSPVTAQIPVLISTASPAFMHDQEKLAQFKEIPIVFKPFNIDALLALIRQLLPDTSAAL